MKKYQNLLELLAAKKEICKSVDAELDRIEAICAKTLKEFTKKNPRFIGEASTLYDPCDSSSFYGVDVFFRPKIPTPAEIKGTSQSFRRHVQEFKAALRKNTGYKFRRVDNYQFCRDRARFEYP